VSHFVVNQTIQDSIGEWLANWHQGRRVSERIPDGYGGSDEVPHPAANPLMQEATSGMPSNEHITAQSDGIMLLQPTQDFNSYRRPYDVGSNYPAQRERGNETQDSSYHTSVPENMPSGLGIGYNPDLSVHSTSRNNIEFQNNVFVGFEDFQGRPFIYAPEDVHNQPYPDQQQQQQQQHDQYNDELP
jgi:hypothetical protein